MSPGLQHATANRAGRALAAVVLGLAFAAMPTSSAAAATWHNYSVAYETSHGSHYSGVYESRIDVQPAYIDQESFQSMWILITGKGWVELGTAHWPNVSQDAWYWGYAGSDGTWHQIGYQRITNGTRHAFQIVRPSTYVWDYYVDGVRKASLGTGTSWTSSLLETGLESYSANLRIGPYASSQLQMTLDYGSWINWDGEDSKGVGSSMCGSWSGATMWFAGQNVGNC